MRKDSRELPTAPENSDGSFARTYVCPIKKEQQPYKEYMYWRGMVSRCAKPYKTVHNTYTDVTMSEYFKDYNNFVKWCKEQKGFNEIGWVLDKDFLCVSEDVKVYSEYTCVFLPVSINSFLTTKRTGVRYYTGVSFQKDCGKFIVSCAQLNGKNKTLARVVDPEKGYYIYRDEKVRLARILYETYGNSLDDRVSEMLYNFDKWVDLFTVNPINKEVK